jgi:mRNA interferase MazF
MNFPKKGEVYLVSLNPVVGSEICKSRPGLIISNNRNNEFADTITVIPITSKTMKVYPFEVFIPKGVGGLEKDSKAKCDQIRTISKMRLIKYLGTLEESYLKEIEKAALIHLGIKHC